MMWNETHCRIIHTLFGDPSPGTDLLSNECTFLVLYVLPLLHPKMYSSTLYNQDEFLLIYPVSSCGSQSWYQSLIIFQMTEQNKGANIDRHHIKPQTCSVSMICLWSWVGSELDHTPTTNEPLVWDRADTTSYQGSWCGSFVMHPECN